MLARVSNKTKKDLGKELENRQKMKAAAFSKSQQEILKKMRERNEEELGRKLTDSLKRAFNTAVDEEGNTLLDEIAAKTAASYKQKESLSINDVIGLQNALGESKNSVDVNVNGKVDIKSLLKEISDESEF